MDQGPLVAEQIDAGAKLAHDFDQRTPVDSAFWLKESEEGQWYLYLVSDQIDDTNFDVAYSEVIRLLGPGPHVWLDPFQVKVAGVADPIAKAAIEIQKLYPHSLPMRLRNRMFGGLSVDDVYIYPIPVPIPV